MTTVPEFTKPCAEEQQAGSNRLPFLAAEIRKAHSGARAAARLSLHHAIEAGERLIEAKALIKHGEWLPWLRENCEFSERTASLYMRLARHKPDLEIGNVADLTIRGAVERLAPVGDPSPVDLQDWDAISEWAQARLDGPFVNQDFAEGGSLNWLRTKILHQANVPFWPAVLLSDKHDLPLLRLCPWDDLENAVKALAPIASEAQPLKFDVSGTHEMQAAIVHVHCIAMWLLGKLLNEIERRYTISEERCQNEWEETHKQWVAAMAAN